MIILLPAMIGGLGLFFYIDWITDVQLKKLKEDHKKSVEKFYDVY